MNDEDVNKIRGVVKEEINSALEPVQKILNEHTNKLDALWDQTVKLTEDMGEVKEVLKSQSSALDKTNDNIEKLDKRLTEVENHSGIVPPPE